MFVHIWIGTIPGDRVSLRSQHQSRLELWVTWKEKVIAESSKILAGILVDGRALPPPRDIDAIVSAEFARARAVASEDYVLMVLKWAYALYVLIWKSDKAPSYYKALRNCHGVRRTDGDVIALIHRSLDRLPVATPQDRAKARYTHAVRAMAVRHLIHEKITPDQISGFAETQGQSVTHWTREERAMRSGRALKKSSKSGQPVRRSKPRYRSVSSLTHGKPSGYRTLVELELVANDRFRVVHRKELTHLIRAKARKARWERIVRAVDGAKSRRR